MASKAKSTTTKTPARKRASSRAKNVAPTTTGTLSNAVPVSQAGEPVTSQESAHPEVKALVEAETERGFRGVEVDQTPNENYTVAGVTSGKPTPETTRTAGTRVPVNALEDGQVVQR